MTRKKGIAATRYANAVSRKGVGELLRKQDGESADIAKEYLPVMIAIPAIHNPTKQASLFVKSIINARHATKSCLAGKKRPDAHMCGEVMCWNCEEYVDPNTHLCYKKPIVNEDQE